MRSTAEWEAALEGTTPGPWGYYAPRGRDGHYDPIFGATPGDEIALVKRPADWKIMSMAPEAVAEVVRLRRELEQLRHECITSAKATEGNARNANNWEALQAVAHTERDTADCITRILEGPHE